MTENKNQKPCLVETGQGFSVSYNEKLLYSKYNPSKQIGLKISSMDFLPGSIILAFSPVLEYGLGELLSKLPENCVILLCEADKNLLEIQTEKKQQLIQNNENLIPVSESEMYDLPVILQKNHFAFECGKTVFFAGNFRRVIRVDFSAGVQFYEDFYRRLEAACVSSVKQFWTNRITLTKFGRRYSHNLFRNLGTISETKPLTDFIKAQEKDIFVFGSGESSEEGIRSLKKLDRNKTYVLCADTAFPMLKSNGIIPDGIVVDEAQSVIAQSFIGARKASLQGVQIFQSLCSLPHVAGRNFPKEKITFYATEYDSNNFFEGLKHSEFLPPVIPAFGSVGITAFILALLFRKNETVPLKYYGLDFAYSAGKTHARETPAHKRQLLNVTKLKGIENFAASYGPNVIKLPPEFPFSFTTPVLSSYAETFRQVKEQGALITEDIIKKSNEKDPFSSAESFIANEKNALIELRNLLSGKEDIPENERTDKIRLLLENRQYLYLHFPDGYKISMELNFLKRVRGEIEGFLKVM